MPHIELKLINSIEHWFYAIGLAARLAQSVEHQTFNLRVMGSSPILGDYVFFYFEEQETMQHIKCA